LGIGRRIACGVAAAARQRGSGGARLGRVCARAMRVRVGPDKATVVFVRSALQASDKGGRSEREAAEVCPADAGAREPHACHLRIGEIRPLKQAASVPDHPNNAAIAVKRRPDNRHQLIVIQRVNAVFFIRPNKQIHAFRQILWRPHSDLDL
jgi:hypothetical protein